MRIISGSKRGQKIIYPKNSNIRPTTDFAKEALFNILNNNYQFSKINVLDLFAGTGNISFEFASRGCKNITCVDINKPTINSLKKNKVKFDFNIKVIQSDALKFLDFCEEDFEIIFCDPPFKFRYYDSLIDKINERNLLKKNGTLVIEHDNNNRFENCYLNKKYGNVNFSFFANE